jgi:hypothetical protein
MDRVSHNLIKSLGHLEGPFEGGVDSMRNNPALGSCLINMVDLVGSACQTVVCAGVLFQPCGAPGSGLQWLLSLGEPNLAFWNNIFHLYGFWLTKSFSFHTNHIMTQQLSCKPVCVKRCFSFRILYIFFMSRNSVSLSLPSSSQYFVVIICLPQKTLS